MDRCISATVNIILACTVGILVVSRCSRIDICPSPDTHENAHIHVRIHVYYHTSYFSDSLRGSSVRIGTMQRLLAWPLREDDTHKSRSVSIWCVLHTHNNDNNNNNNHDNNHNDNNNHHTSYFEHHLACETIPERRRLRTSRPQRSGDRGQQILQITYFKHRHNAFALLVQEKQ